MKARHSDFVNRRIAAVGLLESRTCIELSMNRTSTQLLLPLVELLRQDAADSGCFKILPFSRVM